MLKPDIVNSESVELANDVEIVAHINDSVTLDCKLDGFDHWPTWKFTPVGKNEADELNVAENIRSYWTARYYVLESKTRLVITSVDEGHAGKYNCYDDQEVDVGLSAELQVVAVEPTCSSNLSFPSMMGYILCKFSSRGNFISSGRCEYGSSKDAATETSTFTSDSIVLSLFLDNTANISSSTCDIWIQTRNCHQPNPECSFWRHVEVRAESDGNDVINDNISGSQTTTVGVRNKEVALALGITFAIILLVVSAVLLVYIIKKVKPQYFQVLLREG